MVQRILVFEKSSDFLRELEAGFARYGARVEVFQDPDSALASAKSERPALVLLSVDAMAAPGEAFLVCKKFKGDDALANVPFVIMGGPHHADSFESHKKLKKRRADEYLQLPMGFNDLLDRVGPFVPFAAAAPPGPTQSDELADEDLALDNLGVDDDIDAFADNAFDDLVFDEPEARPMPPAMVTLPAQMPSPMPSPAAVPPVLLRQAAPFVPAPPQFLGAPSVAPPPANLEEVARLKSQVEQLTIRAKGAEERAKNTEERAKTAEDRVRGAEERAKAAETSRLHPTPSATGVSSRDYLDLREQLNRKDKELLGLRDEITTRDRQLLDGSDRSLELERAQAELSDKFDHALRQLHDAHEKNRAYETDKDAINKRTEDLKARLQRTEDRCKRVEHELDTIKVAHARENADLAAAHDAKLKEIESTVSAEVGRMRGSHAAMLEDATEKHKAEVAALQAGHRSSLTEAMAGHAKERESLQAGHKQALSEAHREHEAALSAARAAASSDRDRALAEMAAVHAAEFSSRLADADRDKAEAIDGVREELAIAHAADKQEVEARQGRELAVLGRKLTEVEAFRSDLERQRREQQEAKQEAEAGFGARLATLAGQLNSRTEERDLAQNELASARASVESLERANVLQADKVVRLAAQCAGIEERAQRATAKIHADAELLLRVRKALGIGLGLLDQQQQTVLEGN